jgi:MacB-like periplasmic core domain
VSLSYPDYRDFRDQTGSFEGLAASQLAVFSLGADRHGERAERLFGAVVSGNYFSVLGVTAAQGRTFATDEDSVPGAAPVAVLSDSLWRGRFAGDPLMIGRSISLNGHPITVIGIAPPEFQGTTVGIATALWVPMSMEPQLLAGRSRLELRGIRWVHGLARLKPGVPTDQAEAELRTISERLARDYPTSNDGYHATVMPLWRSPWGAQQLLGPVLLVLMALEPG